MTTLSKPVEAHSVLFRPDGYVEITYSEATEQGPTVNVIRTIILDPEKFEEDLQDLEMEVLSAVDAGLLALRNPPNTERREA